MSTTKITTAPQPLEEVAKINGLVDDLSALETALTAAIAAAKQAAKEEMFPVGSMYVNYLPTNPAELLGFGTWVQASTTLVTSVASTAPVKGNGKSLGVTDNGTNTYSMLSGRVYPSQDRAGLYCSAKYSSSTLPASGSEAALGQNYLLGVTTDKTKSGLVADTSSLATTLAVYIWFRTE